LVGLALRHQRSVGAASALLPAALALARRFAARLAARCRAGRVARWRQVRVSRAPVEPLGQLLMLRRELLDDRLQLGDRDIAGGPLAFEHRDAGPQLGARLLPPVVLARHT